jgi:hypothetical protein
MREASRASTVGTPQPLLAPLAYTAKPEERTMTTRLTTSGPVRRAAAMLGSVLALAACGGSDDDDHGGGGGGGTGNGGGTGSGAGTVTEAWAGFCTGTFTEDTVIVDGFDDRLFTARAGEEYLLAAYGAFLGEVRAEFVYLTSAGPATFEVGPDAAGAFPFTSNCEPDAGVPYYAVFTDVSVYAEDTLTTKLCDLEAGTVLPAASSSPRGYAIAGDGFSLSGPHTYQVYLNTFSASCGGAEVGYISVPESRVFGATTWLVPILGIIGPE